MRWILSIIPAAMRVPVARGFALFLALFTLLNLLGAWRSPGFDANEWWIDLTYLPAFITHTALLVASLALLAFGIGWPNHFAVRRTLWVVSAGLTTVVLCNAAIFYLLWFFGKIHPGAYIPFSLLLSLVFSFILAAVGADWKLPTTAAKLTFIITFLASFILFPLAQMFCFGKTDYRRDADVIVVFGARTYADGTPSQALADRVRTAVELYKQKHAPLLILSGGPGDGKISEPQAMRTLALSLGVPDQAILVDEAGLSTEKTVENTAALFHQRNIRHVLAVSHFYHLPRIKMTYRRALHQITGQKEEITIYTVPAVESAPLTDMPQYIAREIGALWLYYLRPLWLSE
jgi:vancomycin permeability regulator SanA